MDNNKTLSEAFRQELEKSATNTIMDPAYRKKKLILWVIRTVFLVILYLVFWKYDWVRWSLYLTIPLSLFSLFTIVVTPYLLERKIERTKKKINKAEELLSEIPDEGQE